MLDAGHCQSVDSVSLILDSVISEVPLLEVMKAAFESAGSLAF